MTIAKLFLALKYQPINLTDDGYHNLRVGGSSPSSATIYINIINVLQRFKNDFESIFALHTANTPELISHFYKINSFNSQKQETSDFKAISIMRV